MLNNFNPDTLCGGYTLIWFFVVGLNKEDGVKGFLTRAEVRMVYLYYW